MSRTRSWSIAVAAALACTAPLSAQQIPAAPAGFTSMPAATLVTTLVPAPAFGSPLAAEALTGPSLAPVPAVMSDRQSTALMIVGGVGMIVGSLIDGDSGRIIMVGGGALGLYGLYQYLR